MRRSLALARTLIAAILLVRFEGAFSQDTAASAPSFPVQDALAAMALMEAADPGDGARTDLAIRRVWDDGSLFQVEGLYRDKPISLAFRSLWKDKSEFAISGSSGSAKVELDLKGHDAWHDGLPISLAGTIRSAAISLQAGADPESPFSATCFGTMGDSKVDLVCKPDASIDGRYRIRGTIGAARVDLALEDTWGDGSDMRLSGSIK
jgi:hypothetical protein